MNFDEIDASLDRHSYRLQKMTKLKKCEPWRETNKADFVEKKQERS